MVRVTSTCALPAGTVEGENVQLDAAGNPEQAKLRGAVMVGLGVNVMWSVADWPSLTVTDGRFRARLKSGVATVKDCGTFAAALKLLLPACEAVTVHVPA